MHKLRKKIKTNKSALKRFKITAKGKFVHKKSNKRHLLQKKSSGRKRNLGKKAIVCSSDRKRLAQLLSVS